jgi:hypothetical protein
VHAVVFDSTGSRVATTTAQHAIQVWPVETGRAEGPAVPAPEDAEVMGFTADGYLLYSPDFTHDAVVRR